MVGGAAALLVWGSKEGKKLLNKFSFDVVGYAKPTLNGLVLTVPLQIRFTNPTPLPIQVDRLHADVFLEKNGQFVPAAKLDTPVTIQPGITTDWIMPAADLQAIFGGSLLNTLTAAQQIYATKKFNIRSDITVVFKGVTLPMQSITNTIDIS
jgi:hypothetical protein